MDRGNARGGDDHWSAGVGGRIEDEIRAEVSWGQTLMCGGALQASLPGLGVAA